MVWSDCKCGAPTKVSARSESVVCKSCDRENIYIVLFLAGLAQAHNPQIAQLLVRMVDARWYRAAKRRPVDLGRAELHQ